MATEYNPRIVTDNLILYLDAANTKSYPGTGATWTDMSSDLSGTITGATWSNGEFTFDGDNDVISISNNDAFHFGSGDFTVEVWAYFTTLSGWNAVYMTRDSHTHFSPLVITTNNTDLRVYSATGSGSWNILNAASYGTISTNTWYQIVVTRVGNTFTRYLNTSSIGTNTSSSTLWANGSALKIGESVNSMAGKIPIVRAYKGKGLTAAEVKQNFDAHKGRFGL